MPNFVSVVHPVAELAGGEKLTTHSVIHPAYLICW